MGTPLKTFCVNEKKKKKHTSCWYTDTQGLTCALVVLALLVGVEANRLREVIVSANK